MPPSQDFFGASSSILNEARHHIMQEPDRSFAGILQFGCISTSGYGHAAHISRALADAIHTYVLDASF